MNGSDDSVICYVGLGGNYSATAQLMQRAVVLLASHEAISVCAYSSVYITEPLDVDEPQADYLNAVLRCTTTLALPAFFDVLRLVEETLGKQPKPKNAARPIDLDLLFFASSSFCNDAVQVPHPRWHTRRFVVEPLRELAPYLVVDGHIIELDPLLRPGAPLLQQRVVKAPHIKLHCLHR